MAKGHSGMVIGKAVYFRQTWWFELQTIVAYQLSLSPMVAMVKVYRTIE